MEYFKSLNRLFKVGLKAIVCIGESLEQRNSGQVLEVISSQLNPLLIRTLCRSQKNF